MSELTNTDTPSIVSFSSRPQIHYVEKFEKTNDDAPNIQYTPSSFIANPSGTVFSSWTVMSKTMIGSGMLGLSYAMSEAGWVLGIMLFLLSATCAVFTLHLLNIISMNVKARHVTFYSVAELYAPKFRWVVDIAIAIKCFGVGVSYLQVCGSMMARLIAQWSGHHDSNSLIRVLVIVVVGVLLIPVCLQRALSRTRWVNLLGIIALTYVSILSIVYADFSSDAETSVGPVDWIGILSNLGIFIFTFTCHQNMFLVAEDLKKPTQKKLDIIAILSELTAFLVFIPPLILPYITFGRGVHSNFLEDLDSNNIPVQIGFLLLSVAEVCAYPLQLFPSRKSIMVLATRGSFFSLTIAQQNKLRMYTTFLVLVCSVVVASAVTSLGITFDVVGIIGSNTISFIMPTFLFISMLKNESKGTSEVKKTKFANMRGTYIAAHILCAVAICIIPASLGAIIYHHI